MLLKARGWNDLDVGERDDAINSALLYLRDEFPLLLPCDITNECRERILFAGAQEYLRQAYAKEAEATEDAA